MWPPVVCLINVGRGSTESTVSSESEVKKQAQVSVEHEYYFHLLQNTTGMFIENGMLWFIGQKIDSNKTGLYLQMVTEDLETLYIRPDKGPYTIKMSIDKLLDDDLFNYDGNMLTNAQNRYGQYLCTYKTKESNGVTITYPNNYISYGCQPYPSSSVDQLSVACLYYSCNSTLDVAIKTNTTSLMQLYTKDFKRFKNELTLSSYEPQIELIDMPRVVDQNSRAIPLSDQNKRRSFAVSRHPTDPYSYYVMTANMTMNLVKFSNNGFRITQSTIIQGLEGMYSEYVSSMVAIKDHIWCLMPMNRGLAKISKSTASIVKIYDLGFIIDDADDHLEVQLTDNLKLTTNSPPLTNFYMMSSLAFDAKRRLFFVTGHMWTKMYALRIDDDDV